MSEFDCCGPVKRGDLVNLKKQFCRYEIVLEDPSFAGGSCPWHYRIDCRYGFIAPSGGDLLWASIGGRPRRTLDCSVIRRDFGDAFEFHIDDFAAVASYLEAKRKSK